MVRTAARRSAETHTSSGDGDEEKQQCCQEFCCARLDKAFIKGLREHWETQRNGLPGLCNCPAARHFQLRRRLTACTLKYSTVYVCVSVQSAALEQCDTTRASLAQYFSLPRVREAKLIHLERCDGLVAHWCETSPDHSKPMPRTRCLLTRTLPCSLTALPRNFTMFVSLCI